MTKKLLTEDSVKEKLGVISFSNMSPSKLKEFASLLPNMDKEVALGIIGQFSNYSQSMETVISHYKDICTDAIDSNKATVASAIESHRVV